MRAVAYGPGALLCTTGGRRSSLSIICRRFLEGKGYHTSGLSTGDLPDQGKKLRVSNPTRNPHVCVGRVGGPLGRPLLRAS